MRNQMFACQDMPPCSKWFLGNMLVLMAALLADGGCGGGHVHARSKAVGSRRLERESVDCRGGRGGWQEAGLDRRSFHDSGHTLTMRLRGGNLGGVIGTMERVCSALDILHNPMETNERRKQAQELCDNVKELVGRGEVGTWGESMNLCKRLVDSEMPGMLCSFSSVHRTHVRALW